MIVLGLDPSLTNYGWAVLDTNAPVGDPKRVIGRGRFRTPSKMEFLERYQQQRESLREVIRQYEPERVGIEFPIFNDLWSEGMYGLFLFSCEALKQEGCDVVFWTPLQVKSRARESIARPKGWKMDKIDMCEAAKVDTGIGSWNHNEADAYLVAVLASRFWQFYSGDLLEGDLTKVEKTYFTRVHTYTRGKKAGKTVKSGMFYRENDRFFLWSDQGEDDG